MLKYITLDCYGTIIDNEPLYAFIKKIANQLELDSESVEKDYITYEKNPENKIPYLDYTTLIHNNLKHLDRIYECNHEFEKHFYDFLKVHEHLHPFPDVVETLMAMEVKNYQLIMLANSSWDIFPSQLAALKVAFSKVYLSEDLNLYKPDLTFFQTVSDDFALPTTKHYHISENFKRDIVPATESGWPSIWINRDEIPVPDAKGKPIAVVNQFSDVLDYI